MPVGVYHTEIALPENCITTENMLHHLQHKLSDSLQETIHNLCINKRYSIISNYDKYLAGKTERHISDTATSLGKKAIFQLLEKTHINPEDIGLFITVTNTPHRPMPCMAYEIISESENLIPHDILVLNLQAQGCSALLKAMEVSQIFLESHPDKYVLMVLAEAHTGYTHQFLADKYNSLHEIQDNPEEMKRTKDVISHFLFGDGAVAILLKNDSKSPLFFEEIVHLSNLSKTDTDILTMNEGGSTHPVYSGFPHYFMDKSVPKRGMVYSAHLINSLREAVQNRGIDLKLNSRCFIHTGSKKIIDGVCSILKLPYPEENARLSYEILKEYGNLSSASVGFMIHHYLKNYKTFDKNKMVHESNPYGVMITFGVGFSGSAALMRFNS